MFQKCIDIFPGLGYKEKMEMQDQALRQNSKDILNEIGKTLSTRYPVDQYPNEDFADLLAELDKVEYCREVGLDCANQRLKRLLSNTANQTAH